MHLPSIGTEEQRGVVWRYMKEEGPGDGLDFNKLPDIIGSFLLKVLKVVKDPPERIWFPFIPSNCRIWLENGVKFTLRPRKSGNRYCMDLYDGKKVLHRKVGGEFKFVPGRWVFLATVVGFAFRELYLLLLLSDITMFVSFLLVYHDVDETLNLGNGPLLIRNDLLM